MSQNKKIIFRLQGLLKQRKETIMANKEAMKNHLQDYSHSLMLEKELKREQRILKEAINIIQYGFPLEDKEKNSQNNAPNKDEEVIISDEERPNKKQNSFKRLLDICLWTWYNTIISYRSYMFDLLCKLLIFKKE